MILWADDRPYHNIKFLCSQLAGFYFSLEFSRDRVTFFQGSPHEYYRNFSEGNPKIPKKLYFDAFDKLIEENGYLCGDTMRIHAYGNKYHDSDDSNKEEEPLLFFCKALTCEYPMKNQYYAYGPNPTKDKRVPTKEIFCSYYSERSLAKDSDFERICA